MPASMYRRPARKVFLENSLQPFPSTSVNECSHWRSGHKGGPVARLSSCDIRDRQCLPGYRKSSSGLQVKGFSILHRLIDQLLQRRLDTLALRGGLLHQDEKHVLVAVDHKIAAAGAVPFQLADRAGRRRLCIAGLGAHAEAEPEAEAVTRKIEVVALPPGILADMIPCHLGKRLGP